MLIILLIYDFLLPSYVLSRFLESFGGHPRSTDLSLNYYARCNAVQAGIFALQNIVFQHFKEM